MDSFRQFYNKDNNRITDTVKQIQKFDKNQRLLMLNNKNHPEFGWDGGNILLKEGTPQKDNPIIATLVPRFNQAIFFKNNRYSHALTPLQPKYKNMLKRNFLYLALYTENTKNFQ